MRHQLPRLAAIVAAFALTACSSFSGPVSEVATGETEAGTALVDSRGMTLYTLDIDLPNEAMCMGTCALIWSPLMATEDAKPSSPFSLITRASGEWRGELQWAHNGKALYRYTMDIDPGETSGVWPDSVNPNWLTGAKVAKP